jgi:hypothetical protein
MKSRHGVQLGVVTRKLGFVAGLPRTAATNPTVRIVCVKSLTIGSVQFASKSMHLRLPWQPPAQLSRKIQR